MEQTEAVAAPGPHHPQLHQGGDGHIKGIAHIVPDDLILKAIDKGTAAKGQVVAGGSAAGKGHAVHGAGVINVGNISALGGTAGNGLGRGVLVQQVVHLLLQFIFGGVQVVLLQGNGAEVLRQDQPARCQTTPSM